MIDKVYLLAYLFIILALVRVVMTSWRAPTLSPRRQFRATIASGSACCLVPISWQILPLPGRR